MTRREITRLLTPVSVAVAAGLAVAVWFIPLPETARPTEPVRVGPAPNTANAGSIQPVGPTPNHDWGSLARILNTLRDPIEVVDTTIPPPEPPRADPPPAYRYLGMVSTASGQTAALLDLGNGQQRFVAVGDVLRDPGRDDVIVKEITASEVVFQRGVVTTTIQREQAGREASSPSGTRRPNQQPSGRPDAEDRLRDREDIR